MIRALVIFLVLYVFLQIDAKLDTSGVDLNGKKNLDATAKVPVKNDTAKSITDKHTYSTKTITFTKCCTSGEIYNVSAGGCTIKPMNLSVSSSSMDTNHTNLETMMASGKYAYEVKIIDCSIFPNTYMVNLAPNEFEIRENGSILVNKSESPETNGHYDRDHYCLDYFFIDLTEFNESEPYLYEFTVAICVLEEAVETMNTSYIIRCTCMLISCFFIILTVAVYAWLPELRNLHGMVLMAYLMSFFVGFLFLATLQILIMQGSYTAGICVSFTLIIYYGILAAFFWMNVMCYDIWRAVRDMQSNTGSRRYLDRIQFRKYCVYAFGLPTILTGILALHEFAFEIEYHLHPKLRSSSCFLQDKCKFVYLYVPLLLLCVANLLFFGHTTKYILQTTKQIVDSRKKVNLDINRNSNLSAKEHKKRFIVYLKLFVVMGITWFFEVVGYIWTEYDYIWQYTDIYNIMFGLTVFVIFVCKKTVLEKIKHRLLQCGYQIKRLNTRIYKRLRLPSSLSRAQTTSTTLSTRADTQCKEEIPFNCITKY